VQLRNLDTGQVVDRTTSNGMGAFSFAKVPPANYAVELVDENRAVVGASPAMTVSSGATTTTSVAATPAAGAAAAGGATAGGAAAGGTAAGGAAAGGAGIGLSTALIVTTVAVAAGVAGVVVVARDNSSPSN
jgi:hypothetical protein